MGRAIRHLSKLLLLASFVALCIVISRNPVAASEPEAATLTVDANNIRHNIDPNIYGTAFAKDEHFAPWRLPMNRWGGNALSRYNYQNDVYNNGDWWYFTNAGNPDPGTLPIGSSADQFIAKNRSNNTATLLQIPMTGWIPKDDASACGFKVDKYGAQTDASEFGCGSGVVAGTTDYLVGNDPTDTSFAADETFAISWINHLKSQFGGANSGGVRHYQLDNEPMLWHFNHRDVHPEPASFDYVTEKGIRYGKAIKSADPDALVMGPGVWGWQPYYYSAVDIQAYYQNYTVPDRDAHGGMPFLAWYLQEMRKFEEQNGYRILDYIDIHMYPQIYGDAYPTEPLALSPAGSENDQAMRLRSTRELWDRTWQPESWIPEPIYAVRLMQDWIDQHYPGTKIAISEYSWGANEHINGALAQADVLGIYGREGVDIAILWDPPNIGQPVDYAIRMYRNYDGAGSGFGDQSLATTSDNEFDMAIFAAKRSADNATTIMVINKTKNAITNNIAINGMVPSNAEVYRYSSADLNNIQRLSDRTVSGGQLGDTFPAESISLYVLKDATVYSNFYFLPIIR